MSKFDLSVWGRPAMLSRPADLALPEGGIMAHMGMPPMQTRQSTGRMFLPGGLATRSPIPGYRRPLFSAVDHGLGRGYRIGDQVRVPALAGTGSPAPPAQMLVNHGMADHVYRWKISLYVSVPPDVTDVPLSGLCLQFRIFGKAENDRIQRRPSVSSEDGQVIYVHGRSLYMEAINPQSVDLIAHYNLDEASPGLATWMDQQTFSALTAETPLDVSPFAQSITVLSPGSAGPSPVIRGYADGGVLVYEETLPRPRSAALPRVPCLDYTIAPIGAGPQAHIVSYQCVG